MYHKILFKSPYLTKIAYYKFKKFSYKNLFGKERCCFPECRILLKTEIETPIILKITPKKCI